MNKHYKRPPITEAVIALSFEETVDSKIVEKVKGKLADTYPHSENWATYDVRFDANRRTTNYKEAARGFKLSSSEFDDALIITNKFFVVSRLPPYKDWATFNSTARNNWEIWKRIVGYVKIQRIAVRYINRIDIPTTKDQKIRIEDYLKFYTKVPDAHPEILQFTMQIAGAWEENCQVIINSASVPSPLVDHVSFVFDIDIGREKDVPQNDEEVWSQIDRMREYKNRIFESGVTDKARELFDQ